MEQNALRKRLRRPDHRLVSSRARIVRIASIGRAAVPQRASVPNRARLG